MPDYRSLIEQVQNRGGPLRLEVDELLPDRDVWDVRWGFNAVRLHSLPDEDRVEEREVLCGVLRRDLGRRGYDVIQAHRVLNAITTIHMVRVVGSESEPVGASAQKDLLTAHLRAWLEAVPEDS